MSASRGCVPCKTAKAKCDLARPSCGRCTQQGLICSGLPLEDVFIFRNENEVAKRNSQRARRGRRPVQWDPTVASSSFGFEPQGQPSQGSEDVDLETLRKQYSWLNERALAEIPGPLKRDVETRSIDRFFVNWILHPSNHGVSSGYLHELPGLYLGSEQDSVLWLAVRALAFADMKNDRIGDVSFHTKARQHYGAALNRMRVNINEGQDLGSDHVLAAMLLIDNFELMYLARNDLHGPHNEAIKHVLYKRGEGQLYSPTRFSLWRLTHYRLQAWQTLFREEPDAQQIAWVNKLNVERPDLRICGHVMQMNILSALSRTLMQDSEGSDAPRPENLNRARELIQEMQALTISVENWASEMTGVWTAKEGDPRNIAEPQEVDESPNFPIPRFPYPHLITYDDIWLAYIWNFYAASQIVLRETLIEVIEYVATLEGREGPDDDSMPLIQRQREWIDVLSAAILKSFPQLLGFTFKDEHVRRSRLVQQGRMAGRLFALFSMWVVQKAKYVSAQHKQTASEVIAWINSRHELS